MSGGDFPGVEAMEMWVDACASRHPALVSVEDLGSSAEGRPVRAVRVTDPDAPPGGKQTALVVCNRHGNELGGRAVAKALLAWLTSDEAAPTRAGQAVIVVPLANPDGCAAEAFGAPPWHLSETEERTLWALARRIVPDMVVDVHSFGEDDADLQAIILGNNTVEGEDEAIYHAVADRAVAAAADAGFPFLQHSEKRNEGYNHFIAGRCYDQFHSLAFGMEVNHHVLSPEECGRSGLAVIRALLASGNERQPWQAEAGYPVNVLRGDFAASIRPAGATAADRRRSRAAIWRDRKFFHLGRRKAPTPQTAVVPLSYSGFGADAVSHAFRAVCRVRGPRQEAEVTVNGSAAQAVAFSDACSTFVWLDLAPSGKTDYEVRITCPRR